MRKRFVEMIQREIAHHKAGSPARIIGKMNQLEDPEIIAALCEAGAAGVPIDLIVRGFSCLNRPKISGSVPSSVAFLNTRVSITSRTVKTKWRMANSILVPPTGCKGTYQSALR